MADTIQNVAHFVPAGVAGLLEDLDAEVVVECNDTLSHGPSRREPKAHRDVRLAYWRGLYERVLADEPDGTVDAAIDELEESYLSAEQIGSKIDQYVEDRRIVIWSTPTLEDRLFMWLCFDAVQGVDIPANRVATAEPQIPITPGDEENYFSLRDLEVEELLEGFEDLVYPKEIYIQAGAQLWQSFGSASPRQFAISMPHTEKFFPNITAIGGDYGSMFPTVEGEGAETMHPSAFDRELLDLLSEDEWRTPFEVLVGEFVDDFHFVDDLAMAARLQQWADHADEAPYVESRPHEDPAGMFERTEYRLTERGRSLIEEGVGDEDSAPVLELGNCRIYAGPTPWVRVIEGEHWWFERFESGR